MPMLSLGVGQIGQAGGGLDIIVRKIQYIVVDSYEIS